MLKVAKIFRAIFFLYVLKLMSVNFDKILLVKYNLENLLNGGNLFDTAYTAA